MKAINTVMAVAAALTISGAAFAESSGGHGAAPAEHGSKAKSHGDEPTAVLAKRSRRATSGPHWGYHGADGPSAWAELAPEFEACGAGVAQSPINIEASHDGASILPIEFNYNLTPVNVVHNGHTVQLNYEPGSSITVGGKEYALLQFHFHTPSEHAVEGRRAAMEVHFVHRNDAGELAVIGALMESGVENPALAEIWQHMPMQQSPASINHDVLINARDLLPHDKGYFRYMGSLTTPPCSEGVNWYVMQQPIQVGSDQAALFSEAVGNNARPLQAKNSRLLLAPSHSTN